jgi:hypothetical protein
MMHIAILDVYCWLTFFCFTFSSYSAGTTMMVAEEGNGILMTLQMVTMTSSNLQDPTIGMKIAMVEARALVDAVDAITVKMVEDIIEAVFVAGDPGVEEVVPEAVAMAVVVTRPSEPLFQTP